MDHSAWDISPDAVRDRVYEYMGGSPGHSPTCRYIAVCDRNEPARIEKRWPGELDAFLETHAPLARSLDDSVSVIIHLDIEYVNFDDPVACYTDPWRAFSLQEPVVAATEEWLVSWGIRPLHLVTGQGHHFVWRIARDSEIQGRIRSLAFPSQRCGDAGAEDRETFGGLALAMEFFAHQIRKSAAPRSEIPVELTAVHVGPGKHHQREIVSLDVSEYGDPLASRTIRMPFTTYRKPWVSGLIDAFHVDDQIGRFVILPLHEMDWRQCLKARQDSGDIASIARRSCVRIPEEEEGTGRLLADYEASALREFHAAFYRDDHDPPERWPQTYHRTSLDDFPPCVRHILTHPNDLLLKPAGIQLVTRCLWSLGWKPRHIAGLIRSRFEDPAYQWGAAWEGYDPGMRADFYVRLFSGLVATGLDECVDFNCTSQQEKGFCWASPPCGLQFCHDHLLTMNPKKT